MNQYTNSPAPNGLDGQPPVQPNNVMAGISLACGIVAMVIPVPVLDVIIGVLGIILSRMARKTGVGGLALAGFVVSIIGTVIAFFYTIGVLFLGAALLL